MRSEDQEEWNEVLAFLGMIPVAELTDEERDKIEDEEVRLYLCQVKSKKHFTPEEEIQAAKVISGLSGKFNKILKSFSFVSGELSGKKRMFYLAHLKGLVKKIEEQQALSQTQKTRKIIREVEKVAGQPVAKIKELYDQALACAKEMQAKRNQFVEANLHLVVNLAQKHRNKGLTFNDLIQEGNIGLIKAVEKFNHKKGKFSPYASWWIFQTIYRALAEKSKTIRVPVYLLEKIKRVDKVTAKLEHKHGKQPTPEEIATEMNMPLKQVIKLIRIAREPVSLEKLIGKYDELSLANLIEDKSMVLPEESLVSSHLSKQVEKLMESLSPREEKILRMRYGIGQQHDHTLEEIGEEFKLPRKRIIAIEKKQLKKLRHPSKSRLLRSYFEN